MRHTMPILLLLAMLAPLQSGAIEAEERLVGPIPEEVKAFQATSDRFTQRMQEFQDETITFINFREREEREKLAWGYDNLLEDLDRTEKDRRTMVVERFEDFLTRYPHASYTSHVRFRLAELYFEIASENWLKASTEYYRQIDEVDEDDLEALEALDSLEQPKIRLDKIIEMYNAIIEDNKGLPKEEWYEHLDGVYYMLGYCYYEPNATSDDIELSEDRIKKSVLVYQDLVDLMPDSQLADQAHLMLGNALFDDNRFPEATAEYQFVFDKGEEGSFFVDAMYQLAWSQYKLSEYSSALTLFTQLLDHSKQTKLDTGKESDYAKDAITYMAHSFADIAEHDEFTTAASVAEDYFAKDMPREHEWDVYKALAEVLVQYQRTDEAVECYKKLQNDPRWVNNSENPEFQMQVVTLLGTGLFADVEAAGAERLELTLRYNEGGEWWVANRSNPDALNLARSYIESSLLQVAVEFRVRAQESGEPADFKLAADKYKEYLDKFPISDDYYKQQWFLADSYAQAQMYAEGEAEYSSLIESQRYHGYGDGAVYQLMDMRLKVALEKVGPPDVRPENAEVLKTYVTDSGIEITVYQLTPEHQAFVDAADQVLGHKFSEPKEGLPDYQKAVDERRHAVMYIAAQILYNHNHFEGARPRFVELYQKYPRTNEASYAAGLLVDSYLAEGDLEQVRYYSKLFSTMILGEQDLPNPEFANILEGTAFKQAKGLADAGDFAAAADAFIEFRKEFPHSEHDAFALYNAAHYYQEVGKAERANELFEEFVNIYAKHEWSKKLYFRIAANYESTFDLEKAVDYYGRLVRMFPDYVDASNALYNSSFLKIGLGDHHGAAKGFEDYARMFPDVSDRENVFFRAGEQWEQVSPNEAIKFYKKYLKDFDANNAQFNADHTLKAMYRLGELYAEQGNERAHQRQLDEVLVAFDSYVGQGLEMGPDARGYAAEAFFREIQVQYDALVKDELTRDDDKDAELLNVTKPEELKEFKLLTDGVVTRFNNFEYSTAALYLQGMTLFYYADLGLDVKPPKGLSEEDQWAYMDILEEQFYPKFYEVEDKGIAHIEKLIDAAKTQKRHSEWVAKAYAVLNKRRPADYPAIKDEVVGRVDSTIPPDVRPVRMKLPDELQAELDAAEKQKQKAPVPNESVPEPESPESPAPETPVPDAPAPDSPESPAPETPDEPTDKPGGEDSPWGTPEPPGAP